MAQAAGSRTPAGADSARGAMSKLMLDGAGDFGNKQMG